MNRLRPAPAVSRMPATATVTPTAKHARTPSAAAVATPMGSTTPLRLSLFITNLRLLDLDLLPDWPDVSTAALTGSDVRQRIRCAEFALYHLFRLYSPAVTADKLQPFFPPLEPLQSVNLRAALYRCLLELKKSATLSREILLRKTMLDECQGEKFVELCVAFSAEVLRKVTRERKVKHVRPVAERLSIIPSPIKESLLPLAVAHKASLSKVLERKQKQCETYAWLYDVLQQKEAELQERRGTVEQNERQRPSSGQAERLRGLENGINAHWMGNDEFKHAVIDGDGSSPNDSVLTNPFNEFWQSKGETVSSKYEEIGILHDLERRVNQQSQRVRNWHASHDRIVQKRPASEMDSPCKPTATSVRFDEHQELKLHEKPQASKPPPSPERTGKDMAALRYDEILTAMREELRYGRTPSTLRSRRVHTAPVLSPRKLSDAQASARNDGPGSPSPTTVPIRPLMSRNSSISSVGAGVNHARNPSRSRSYQAPRMESQRQPIPLKTEAASPRKGSQSSITPPISTTSETPSTDGEYEVDMGTIAGNRMRSVSWRQSQFSHASHASQSSEMDKTIDSGIGLGLDSDDKRASLDVSSVEDTDKLMSTPTHAAFPTSQPIASTKVRPQSLAERTRMSMAGSRPSIDLSLSAVEPESPPKNMNRPGVTDRPSLFERTRQSISIAPASVPAVKATPKHARTRSAFDISCATPTTNPALQRRDITPRDDIFSPDAQYDSVFKSRPKIKLSPVLSPRSDVDVSGIDGMVDSPHGNVILDNTF